MSKTTLKAIESRRAPVPLFLHRALIFMLPFFFQFSVTQNSNQSKSAGTHFVCP
jgi:hypothetical protein